MRGGSLLAVLGMMAGASASGLATPAEGDIAFTVDTAVFGLPGSDSLAIEIYESVPIGQFAPGGDGQASFQNDLVLVSMAGDTVAVQQWITEVEWVEGRSVVYGSIMMAPPGDFDLHLSLTDLSNGRMGHAGRPLTLVRSRAISELEVANTIVPVGDDSRNPLRKGAWVVFPAADGRFDLPGEGRAYIYAEVYGLGGMTLQRQSRLVSASGEPLFARPWDILEIPDDAQAVGLLDSLDLSGARMSGLHYLEVSIIASGDTLTARKPVMITRASQAAAETPETGFPETDVSRYLPQLFLILQAQEKAVFEALPDDGARALFYGQYWLGRDAERADYEARCGAAESYATAFRDGWETDRGRVLIKYGLPDDIERMPLQVDTLPYEIWSYYRQGADVFVFVDRTGTGSFIQVHSSVSGEPSYPNWEQMLTPAGTPGSTMEDS